MAGQQVAERLMRILETVLAGPVALRLRAWDGSEAGPPDGPVVVVRNRRALRRLVWRPDEVGLARAYVSGDLDLQGDVFAALQAASVVVGRDVQPSLRLSTPRRRELLGAAVRLGALGPPPSPPQEEVRRLRGAKHSRYRDRAAVSHHYDVGNDFYRLVLGPSLVYSCAYWTRPDDPAYTLEDAQRDKLELVCRKLGLAPGMRLLDVGCGWGSLVLHAAQQHGVRAVGITLSQQQAELAAKRVSEAGLSDAVDIRLQDYRDVDDGPYDAIASIGMAEHVGAPRYAEYAAALHRLLRPGGRLLNHQIARRPGAAGPSRETFISAYVFPDGELLPLAETVGTLEDAGFEVRDVEALREHYPWTLRRWVANLEAHWDQAVALTSEGRARVWRLYMAGSALGFEANRLGVNQVLAVRPAGGRSGMPATRAQWLGPGLGVGGGPGLS